MMICLISGKETAVEMKTTANEEVIFTNRYMNLLSQMYWKKWRSVGHSVSQWPQKKVFPLVLVCLLTIFTMNF